MQLTPDTAISDRARRAHAAAGRRGQGDQGAVLVELAIVLPLLLMLIFGIYEFGRGYNAKVELTGAVREGARAAALGKSTSEVQTAVQAASPGLSPSPAVAVVTPCSGSNTDAVVRATYDLGYTIPFVGSGTWTLSAQGVMRCGL